MIIFIIGITGVGKSVLGKQLARKLNMNFVDLDAYVQIRENKTIEQMFEISQEYFRKAETNALFATARLDNHVISTGGGIVLNAQNIEFMKSHGFVLHLHRPIGDIVKRLNIKKRPLLKNKSTIYTLYEQRKKPL